MTARKVTDNPLLSECAEQRDQIVPTLSAQSVGYSGKGAAL